MSPTITTAVIVAILCFEFIRSPVRPLCRLQFSKVKIRFGVPIRLVTQNVRFLNGYTHALEVHQPKKSNLMLNPSKDEFRNETAEDD